MKKESYKSFAGKGIDVASKRADDLDRLALEHFSKKDNPRVLDLGCGAGGQSVRMAKAGVSVLAVDSYDFTAEFNVIKDALGTDSENLEYIYEDINNLPELIKGRSFTDAYMQRTLHYLKYKQAEELLCYLYTIVEDRLYISVTGIESEAGAFYPAADTPVYERWAKLNPLGTETYSISEPVCLYTQDELISLLEKTNWRVLKCWVSTFGNIKAVCGH